MALADWEVILGGGLQLTTQYKVSGQRSLTQVFNGGATHIVHKQTYNDAPLNVELRTWMTTIPCDMGEYRYIIGGVARKQPNANTYFYWCLFIHLYLDESVVMVTGHAGHYINGTQTEVVNIDLTDDFVNKIGGRWCEACWRFVRMVGYGSEGKFNMSIEMTPDITPPDPNNPPLDQLKAIFGASIDIPAELANGGACGLIVGGTDITGDNHVGAPLYDYTQIFY
ncbi:MAG: hypothetical protein JRC90_11890 [Deltaproteobacteria bacterium]|nr:hypothetical protein [Deltaproteobacteria bacterium]